MARCLRHDVHWRAQVIGGCDFGGPKIVVSRLDSWTVAVTAVHQAYRFALDPTPSQERALRSHAGAARFAWNWGLARCIERYEAEKRWYSAAELHKIWNAAKKVEPALSWWGENSKCAYQESFRDLDRGAPRLH